MNYDLLIRYEEQMGIRVVEKPIKLELERVQLYPSGMLKEVVERLINLSKDQAMETNYEAFTNSNISAMHSMAKVLGYKLHCLRNGNKRILYAEKRE